jgi:Uma2 family endonuclease
MTTEAKPRPATALDVRRFTPAEFLALAEVGILTSGDRVELLDGVIIKMTPIGDPHAATVDIYTEMLPSGVDRGTLLRVRGPLALDEHSRLYPDLMLLRRREDYYRLSPPTPENVLLLIEVAETSVEYDRNEKLPRYANAGIPEVWLTILPERIIEAHTEPSSGRYAHTRIFALGDTITAGCFPDVALPVSEILPG